MLDDRNGILTPDPQRQQRQAGKQITDAELPDRPTIKQVAAWIGKSPNTVYLWARKGEIPRLKVGRSYIFDKGALLKWARPEEAT